ncbi:hypothetical protein GCM10027456_22930 [Kineosporia babensis]
MLFSTASTGAALVVAATAVLSTDSGSFPAPDADSDPQADVTSAPIAKKPAAVIPLSRTMTTLLSVAVGGDVGAAVAPYRLRCGRTRIGSKGS